MAYYFKFHSLADLAAEVARLSLDLRFSDDLTPLFAPARIGPLAVGNRLCVQPMEGCDGTRDGRPDELTFRRYQRFGAGGAKLIWAEATAVVEEGRANPRQLLLNEQTAPDLGACSSFAGRRIARRSAATMTSWLVFSSRTRGATATAGRCSRFTIPSSIRA